MTPSHVVLSIFENHSYSEIVGSSAAPYINSLIAKGLSCTAYSGVSHPSEPNYLALFAGSTFGVTDDNFHAQTAPNIATLMPDFIGYAENAGDQSLNPAKHLPWEMWGTALNVERDFSTFPSDFTKLPRLSWVVPNLNDDMHDGTVQQGDSWLQANLNAYVQWCLDHANDAVFILTFDEDDTTVGGPIVCLIIGGGIAAQSNSQALNHYSLLRLIQDWFGTTYLTTNVSGATAFDVQAAPAPAPAPTPTPSPTVSPDGTSITPTSGGSLITADGTWTFGTSTGPGGTTILLNGDANATGWASGVELIVENGGQLYQLNSLGDWFVWSAGQWLAASGPLPAPAPTPTPTPSGDDSPTIQALLDEVATGVFITIPPKVYNIATPLTLAYAHSVRGGGIAAEGVVLQSTITNGADVLTISIAAGGNDVRDTGIKDLTIIGNGKDGNGLRILGPDNTSWFYNFVVRDLVVEGVGGHGVYATGSVFEAIIENARVASCGGNGATLGTQGSGIMSSITWRSGSVRKNSGHGIALVGGSYDIAIEDTYFVENGLSGLDCPNGVIRVQGGGFENNQMSGAGSAVTGQNFALFIGCTEGGNNGKQTSLLSGFYLVSNLTLVGVRADHGFGSIGGTGTISMVGCAGSIQPASSMTLTLHSI